MNDLVKNSIEARKTAIFNGYDIKDDTILDKINSLFSKINDFGENCVDSTDFETKFASSELNQEYINLFTEIATKCSPKTYETTQNSDINSDGQYVLEDITSEIKYQAESAIQPLRTQARQEVYDKVRDIPVVGDVLNVKQHIDFFSRFKKKKDKNENN